MEMYNIKVTNLKSKTQIDLYSEGIFKGFKGAVRKNSPKKWDDLTNLEKADRKARNLAALKKRKRILQQTALVNIISHKSKFLTLTFDPALDTKNIRFYKQKVQGQINNFLTRLARANGQKRGELKYMGSIEKHKNKALHVHLIIFSETKKLDIRKIWGHGRVDFKVIRPTRNNEYKVSNYITKYIVKELESHFLDPDYKPTGKVPYLQSRSLKQPKKEYLMIRVDLDAISREMERLNCTNFEFSRPSNTDAKEICNIKKTVFIDSNQYLKSPLKDLIVKNFKKSQILAFERKKLWQHKQLNQNLPKGRAAGGKNEY